jgi:lipopolysaccharide export system protein LptA
MIKKILLSFFGFLLFYIFVGDINANQSDEPIEIYADDGIEWHKNEKKYLAIGNAKATQGSLSLKSDLIEAFYEENSNSEMDIIKVQAHKNVLVTDDKVRITGGNSAEFNVVKDHFKITGKKLQLTSERDKLNANKKIEYWRSKNIAVATGKAVAIKKDEFVIKGEKLVWHIEKKGEKMNIKKILGFENVSIETNNEVAFSDKALYNKSKEICKLFGNVRLQKGESFLFGDYAEVDLKKGISKLMPAPTKNQKKEERVKALINKEGLKTNE